MHVNSGNSILLIVFNIDWIGDFGLALFLAFTPLGRSLEALVLGDDRTSDLWAIVTLNHIRELELVMYIWTISTQLAQAPEPVRGAGGARLGWGNPHVHVSARKADPSRCAPVLLASTSALGPDNDGGEPTHSRSSSDRRCNCAGGRRHAAIRRFFCKTHGPCFGGLLAITSNAAHFVAMVANTALNPFRIALALASGVLDPSPSLVSFP